MDHKSKIINVVLCEQAPQVVSFVQYLTYWQCLTLCNKPFEGDFIDEACYTFLEAAIIAWCNVFADHKSDVYWSKLIKKMTEDVKYDLEKRILNSTGLDEKKYQNCINYIKKVRDKYFAHRDRDWQNHIWESPDFQNAYKIAEEYESWLNDLLNSESPFITRSLADIKISAEGEADRVAQLLSIHKD